MVQNFNQSYLMPLPHCERYRLPQLAYPYQPKDGSADEKNKLDNLIYLIFSYFKIMKCELEFS